MGIWILGKESDLSQSSISIATNDLAPYDPYRLLVNVVVPRPIAWVSSYPKSERLCEYISLTGFVVSPYNLHIHKCNCVMTKKPFSDAPCLAHNLGR